MPIIRVETFPNRTVDQKRKLSREPTDGFVRAWGGPSNRLQAIITAVDRENWSVGSELTPNR